MRHIFSPAGRAALRGVAQPAALLAFDYDGTLAPQVANPAHARLAPAMHRRLARLGRLSPRVAILSGRALADLMPRLGGLRLAAIVGNHGAEWRIGDREDRKARGQSALRRSREEIAALDSSVARALEDKGLTYIVHLGRLSAGVRRAVLAALGRQPAIRTFGDALTMNVAPIGAPNKGDALRRLERELHPSTVLFVGDDLTDEDAFGARLHVPFLGIRVGRGRPSAAHACLESQGEVSGLLDELLRYLDPRQASDR